MILTASEKIAVAVHKLRMAMLFGESAPIAAAVRTIWGKPPLPGAARIAEILNRK